MCCNKYIQRQFVLGLGALIFNIFVVLVYNGSKTPSSLKNCCHALSKLNPQVLNYMAVFCIFREFSLETHFYIARWEVFFLDFVQNPFRILK